MEAHPGLRGASKIWTKAALRRVYNALHGRAATLSLETTLPSLRVVIARLPSGARGRWPPPSRTRESRCRIERYTPSSASRNHGDEAASASPTTSSSVGESAGREDLTRSETPRFTKQRPGFSVRELDLGI